MSDKKYHYSVKLHERQYIIVDNWYGGYLVAVFDTWDSAKAMCDHLNSLPSTGKRGASWRK